MTLEIILVALVLIMCIAADKFSGRFGMPALILFIGIGMLFGCLLRSPRVLRFPAQKSATAM